MTKQDEQDARQRDKLDRKELKRLADFTDLLMQDASAAIVAIPPEEWEAAEETAIETVEGEGAPDAA